VSIAGPGLALAALLAFGACAVDRAAPDAGVVLSDAGFRTDVNTGPACGGGPGCASGQFCSITGKCITAVSAVAAGTVHTCAVHRDGQVSCWGLGAFIGPGLAGLTPPVFIRLPERARAIAVGIQAACAVLDSGRVSCWGDLGQGTEGPAPVVTEDGAALEGITLLAGGSVAFCASGAAATYCWGENKASELARPATMTFPPRTAVKVLDRASTMIAASVAILVHDGTRLCGWGNNDSAIAPGPRGIVESPTCAADPLPDLRQLAAGDGHACARRGERAFSCWGSNAGGQLGNGDETMMDVPLPGVTQTFDSELVAIAAGAYHTCALGTLGSVWCWGSNQQGECGSPSSAPFFKPAPVMTGAVAIGSGAGAQHTCVVVPNGSVECWGSDLDGQLGSGALKEDDTRYSPTPRSVRW
jgi:alpha-tubulin suppressor-like RCC1 family protein